MSTKKLLLVFLTVLYLVTRLQLIDKYPSIWPDESIYADIAQNIVNEGRQGTDLFGDMFPGSREHIIGYPPFYLYATAAWFKLYGFSIYSQRTLSIITGLFFLVTLYFFSRSLSAKGGREEKKGGVLFTVISIFFLVLDNTFLQASLISRPEIAILFYGTLSLTLFNYSDLTQKQTRLKNLGAGNLFFLIAAGLTAGIAILQHFLGIVFLLSELSYLLVTRRAGLFKDKNFYVFISPVFLALSIWFLTVILPNISIQITHLGAIAAFRKDTTSWLEIIFRSTHTIGKMAFVLLAASTILILIFNRFLARSNYSLLSIILIFSWFFPLLGKNQWYFVLPIPFVYLGLSLLASELNKTRIKNTYLRTFYREIITIIVITYITLSLKSVYSIYSEYQEGHFSYWRFGESITRQIPSGNTVFVSTIPDAYFILKKGGSYKIFEFPPAYTTKEKFITVLDQSEYIIYNAPLSVSGLDRYLKEYISKNALNTTSIGNKNQYHALIIELKSKPEREGI